MEKYGNIADFFIATLDDEDLRNKLLSCKTIDKMYDFVSTLCSEKFSKEKFEIFISKMIKNHLVDKRIPNNSLQEVSGGRFQEMSGRNGKMEEIFKKIVIQIIFLHLNQIQEVKKILSPNYVLVVCWHITQVP